jgi:hypothetical protein
MPIKLFREVLIYMMLTIPGDSRNWWCMTPIEKAMDYMTWTILLQRRHNLFPHVIAYGLCPRLWPLRS